MDTPVTKLAPDTWIRRSMHRVVGNCLIATELSLIELALAIAKLLLFRKLDDVLLLLPQEDIIGWVMVRIQVAYIMLHNVFREKVLMLANRRLQDNLRGLWKLGPFYFGSNGRHLELLNVLVDQNGHLSSIKQICSDIRSRNCKIRLLFQSFTNVELVSKPWRDTVID